MDRNLPGLDGTTFINDIKEQGYNIPRITSYNVCYTKLLRNQIQKKEFFVQQ